VIELRLPFPRASNGRAIGVPMALCLSLPQLGKFDRQQSD